MQLAQPRPAPVIVSTKKEVSPVPLDGSFGDKPKKPLTVEEIVNKAILKNSLPPKISSVRTEPLHYHQCARCGTVFGHTDASKDNKHDHMCPNCGYGPNWTIIRKDK